MMLDSLMLLFSHRGCALFYVAKQSVHMTEYLSDITDTTCAFAQPAVFDPIEPSHFASV